jgi:hypothetical protein
MPTNGGGALARSMLRRTTRSSAFLLTCRSMRQAMPWPGHPPRARPDMMYNRLETRRSPCERARRSRFKVLGENLLVTLRRGAAEPARPQPDTDKPSLRSRVRQCSLAPAVNTRRNAAKALTSRRLRYRSCYQQQLLRFDFNAHDNKPTRCQRDPTAHDGHSPRYRLSSGQIAPIASVPNFNADWVSILEADRVHRRGRHSSHYNRIAKCGLNAPLTDPTQGVLTDGELACVVADNHRVMEKSMGLDAASQRALGCDLRGGSDHRAVPSTRTRP